MIAVMSKKKASRKFEDRYRLASRSLLEIRQGMDREVDRLRWQHAVRVGDEPLSLTTLVNGLMIWYLSLPEAEKDRAAISGCAKLDQMISDPASPVDRPAIVTDIPLQGPGSEGTAKRDHKVAQPLGRPKRRG